jgi:hypothetical protein
MPTLSHEVHTIILFLDGILHNIVYKRKRYGSAITLASLIDVYKLNDMLIAKYCIIYNVMFANCLKLTVPQKLSPHFEYDNFLLLIYAFAL